MRWLIDWMRWLRRLLCGAESPELSLRRQEGAASNVLRSLAGNDEMPGILARAITRAATDGRWTAEKGLRDMMQGGRSHRLCNAVIVGLHAGPKAVEPLSQMLEDTGGEDGLVAAVALGHLGDARAIPRLAAALLHEHANTRLAAAMAFGHLGAPSAAVWVQLESLAGSDPDPGVRQACRGALTRINEALRRGPTELEAAEAPAGRGTEPEAASGPAGRGTELLGDCEQHTRRELGGARRNRGS